MLGIGEGLGCRIDGIRCRVRWDHLEEVVGDQGLRG